METRVTTIREEAERIIGEDRVPTQTLANIIAEHGDDTCEQHGGQYMAVHDDGSASCGRCIMERWELYR